eukprot:gene413-435_t
MLVLGGAAVIHVLTGIDINIASFLMPLSTVFYTAAGGLKASFISAYIHVILVLALMCTFVFQVYATSTELGSTEAVYDRLTRVVHLSAQTCQDFGYTSTQTCGPIKGNLHGSYVTFWSSGGLMFGVANIVGCFGCVFLDQAYYNTAIACKPSTTSRGFMLGGICWFAIPFALGTAMGLAAAALQLPVNTSEANLGLVPAAVAVDLLGQKGAILILCMVFMAVTASGASEMMAVSNLITYDVYRTYLNPKAVAIACWIVAAYIESKTVSIESLGTANATLVGNIVALLFSTILMIVLTLWDPDDYEFDGIINGVTLVEAAETGVLDKEDYDPEKLATSYQWIVAYSGAASLLLGVYPKGYFKFWVYVSILWALISTATSVVLTVIEARSLITEVLYDGDKLGNNSAVVGGAGGPVNRLGLVAVTRGSSVNRLGLMASASSGSVNRLGLSSTE